MWTWCCDFVLYRHGLATRSPRDGRRDHGDRTFSRWVVFPTWFLIELFPYWFLWMAPSALMRGMIHKYGRQAIAVAFSSAFGSFVAFNMFYVMPRHEKYEEFFK
ncbi:hypothetical protein Y032_0111g257 [Ancylostoma ceylanicum]|uniref:Uncharacterized protein n=1 Tax=Ancylostoma ceylanicum TaxID=53326 RepID=A0A016TDQ4_9BILA|nr:hypothetical protein Y032_0111g257 [Ancylostoma ceylanicum]